MTNAPLLAHLAERFVSQRENLATESLVYILSRSRVARQAVIRSLRLSGAVLPDDLHFSTQAAGDDDAIPDVVGEDDGGTSRLIIEAKFWAGLTDAQPCAYLGRLHPDGSGVLLFVVPERRIDLVWGELLRRCAHGGLEISDVIVQSGARRALAGATRRLMLISWRAFLANILSDLESAGEILIASDLRQLQGLCEREDSEAFLPLSSAELSGESPRRVLQFSDLVDDLTARLVENGAADVRRLRAAAGKGWYGKYLRLHGIGCLLHFSAWKWSRNELTPLWLRVIGPTWSPPHAGVIRHIAGRGALAGVQVISADEGAEIPLFLPVGVPREDVFSALLSQVMTVAGWLQELAVAVSDETTPSPEDVDPLLRDRGELGDAVL